MKVKIFDFEHEEDLEEEINEFISDKQVIDIKYEVAMMYDNREQVYCYSALVMYED
ncbi:sporulation protein Cse60 [Mycoplasmatota bacterium WC44]